MHKRDDAHEETEIADQDVSDTKRKQPKRVNVVQDTGCLYSEYDWYCHQFIAHLRRVHAGNPPIKMAVAGFEAQQLVKAADPLAKPGIPLCYFQKRCVTTTVSSNSGIML